MYLIDKNKNRISKIDEKSFTELGFKEKQHLQEWLANTPEALGEELLIIQKEFAGFTDTNERLDLLALDKQGNLVIIENKLDDTGRDVTWQVLKYASYCSSLSKIQIKNIYQEYLNKQGKDEQAEDNLSDFFGADYEDISLNKGQTQRIMMVAGNFRKEATSTVLWLLNYKLRIQCFKVTPSSYGEQLFLNLDQIIPMKGAEEYVISMAEKTQEDITDQEELKTSHIMRLEFWKELLMQMNVKSDLFANITPSKEAWIVTGSGVGGAGLTFGASKKYARVELYISRANTEENKFIFDELFKRKDEIEKSFGESLTWERLDNKKASRIKYQQNEVNVFNKDDWPKMISFLIDAMVRFEKALKEPLNKINQKLKTRNA
jgi:hypothetical protein